MYSEVNGWAFKAIDYILFPTGLLQRNGSLFVTMGRNDNQGWALVVDTAGFVASMKPVRSRVTQNSFFKHVAYSIQEQGKEVDGGGSLGISRSRKTSANDSSRVRGEV